MGTKSIGDLSRVTEKLVQTCTDPLGLAVSVVICSVHKGNVTRVAKTCHLCDISRESWYNHLRHVPFPSHPITLPRPIYVPNISSFSNYFP